MKKKYVILNKNSEYLTDYDENTCGWSFLATFAMIFDTYQKAHAVKRKLNKSYGCEYCCVEKFDVD